MIDPKREDAELEIIEDDEEFAIDEDGETADLSLEDRLLEEGGF